MDDETAGDIASVPLYAHLHQALAAGFGERACVRACLFMPHAVMRWLDGPPGPAAVPLALLASAVAGLDQKKEKKEKEDMI